MDQQWVAVLTYFRGLLLLTMMAMSILCIVAGVVIFWRQAAYLLGKGRDEAQVTAREIGVDVRFKTVTGFGLILAGLASGHAVVRTPIHVKVESSAPYGLGSVLPMIFTPALAGQARDDRSLSDFCEFTARTTESISEVQGADGSSLTLDQDRLLHALNRLAHGDTTVENAPVNLIGSTIVSDRAIARHLRYVLVQAALPQQSVIQACRRLKAGATGLGDPAFVSIRDKLEE